MDALSRLLALLAQHQVAYRSLDHPAEGQTDKVSGLRGHHPHLAAKCLVLMVKLGKRTTRFVLAVVPGDCKIDVKAVARIYDASYVGFASTQDAERLSGCVAGTVLPFTFTEDMPALIDETLFEAEEMYFNAGRLDQSIAIRTADYRRMNAGRIVRIAVGP